MFIIIIVRLGQKSVQKTYFTGMDKIRMVFFYQKGVSKKKAEMTRNSAPIS